MISVLFLRVQFSRPPRSHTPTISSRNSPGRSAPASLLLIFHLPCGKNSTEPTGFSPSPTSRLGRWYAISPVSGAIYSADRDNASAPPEQPSCLSAAFSLLVGRYTRQAANDGAQHGLADRFGGLLGREPPDLALTVLGPLLALSQDPEGVYLHFTNDNAAVLEALLIWKRSDRTPVDYSSNTGLFQ